MNNDGQGNSIMLLDYKQMKCASSASNGRMPKLKICDIAKLPSGCYNS